MFLSWTDSAFFNIREMLLYINWHLKFSYITDHNVTTLFWFVGSFNVVTASNERRFLAEVILHSSTIKNGTLNQVDNDNVGEDHIVMSIMMLSLCFNSQIVWITVQILHAP
jgi:hypothetical protein